MKKLSLLLSFIMLFTVIVTACNESNGNVSDTSSVSYEASENAPLSVLTNVNVKDNPGATVISNGASYKTTKDADPKYEDTYNTELTDGVFVSPDSPSYGDLAYAGYPIGYGSMNITMDLGEVHSNVYGFELSYLASKEAGCGVPSSVTVRVSLDGKKWINRGALKIPEFVEGTTAKATLSLTQYVNVRYVRFTVNSQASWFFIDEISVIADAEGNGNDIAYLEAVNGAYAELGSVSAPSNGSAINRELDKVLISNGAKYTVKGDVNPDFSDDSKKLTDGKFSGYYEGETWVGFKGGQDITVKLDLGKEVNDIAAIEASFFVNTATKIFLPSAVTVTAYDKDNKPTELGILYGSTALKNGNYVFSLPFAKTVSARYIEFKIRKTECITHLVEEFAVYSYREAVTEKLYPDVIIEKNDGTWKSGDGSSYENLIKGKTQQILSSNDPGSEFYGNNTPVTSTLMTDGKLSSATGIHNGYFFKFNYGGERKVIYDLENIAAVDKFTASFTHQTDWTVNKPEKVMVYVSNTGSDWYEAGEIKLEGSGDPALYRGTLKLSRKVQARYVVFAFDVKGWVGCDELEVYGTKSSSGASAPSKVGLTKKSLFEGKRIEPSADIMNGAKDLCLLYHSHKSEGYDVESILPYVAYLDKDGNPQDIMFDSILFLAQNGSFPSGGLPHKDSIKSDWEWVNDDLFAEGKNIMALEEAVGQVKKALNLGDDYKYKVALTLYYPTASMKNFGDVDGDGVSEDFTDYKNRIKALKWFIDETEKRFAEQNFQNIELVAYYWWHENVEKDDADTEKMLNDVSDYVHKLDRDFIWIPYFTANGYNKWADLGFDAAVMQPNYVFTAEAPYSNVGDCANLTALYGMGVEMELFEDVLSKELFFKKYMQYIAGGVEYGYMNDSIIMYYQSVTAIRDAAYSKSTMARTVYEQTYHFIKGDLKYKPDTLDNLKYEAKKDTPYNGDLGISDDRLYQLALDVVPDHGSVTLNNDGTFTYYPEKGYTGEVKFSFVYSEYLGWSDPCEVTITVK